MASLFNEVQKEPRQGCWSIVQLLDFLDVGRTVHLQYRCAFVGVGFYSPMCDHKAQELASTDLENAFFWVEAHVVFEDFSQYLFQAYHVLGYALRLNDYVANVDLDISFDMLFGYLVHQSLVCSACIFQAKGHDPIAKVGIFSDECRFLLV